MYGNNVVYGDKWDTFENRFWSNKLIDTYFKRSTTSSFCPQAWAKEVYELLVDIDKKYGINRATYRQDVSLYNEWYLAILKNPFLVLISALKESDNFSIHGNFFYKLKYACREFLIEAKRSLCIFNSNITYALFDLILRPKVSLNQVKEKYCLLTVYTTASPEIEAYIDSSIKRTEIKLALKGAYYSLEELYSMSILCANETDGIKTSYPYRDVMRKLNIDIIAIEKKVNSDKKT